MFNNLRYIRKPDFSRIKKMDYDEYWRLRGGKINNHLKPREQVIFNLVGAGFSVLDVGCGNSFLPIKLKEKGCDVTCMDISDYFFSDYQGVGIKTDIIDLEATEKFKNIIRDKYHCIVLSEVLEHTRNPEEILAEISNYSKRIFITIPNSAYFIFRFGLLFSGHFFTQWEMHPAEHLRFWSHDDFLSWLQALGFKVVRAKSSNGVRFLKNIWPNMFGFQMVYEIERS